jgi:hypothetical protein
MGCFSCECVPTVVLVIGVSTCEGIESGSASLIAESRLVEPEFIEQDAGSGTRFPSR